MFGTRAMLVVFVIVRRVKSVACVVYTGCLTYVLLARYVRCVGFMMYVMFVPSVTSAPYANRCKSCSV